MPNRCGRRDQQFDRHSLDGHPERPPLRALDHRHDLGQRREPIEHTRRLVCRADDAQVLAQVTSPPDVPRRLAAQRRRDALHQIGRAVEQQTLPGSRVGLAVERLQQPRLGLGADPGDIAQAAGGRRFAELLGGTNVQRSRQLDRAVRGQTQVAPEPHQVGRELTLELGQLRDLTRLQ